MTYAEKLKDPRWQKKRLEIMQRDEFTCQKCGNKEQTLHIHHKTYEFGNDPWDYEDKNFITLCDYCHSNEEIVKIHFNYGIKYLLKNGYYYEDLVDLIKDDFMKVYKANEQKGNQNG
jgi:5-methylcytosine-specific restriction endonuclease McrA